MPPAQCWHGAVIDTPSSRPDKVNDSKPHAACWQGPVFNMLANMQHRAGPPEGQTPVQHNHACLTCSGPEAQIDAQVRHILHVQRCLEKGCRTTPLGKNLARPTCPGRGLQTSALRNKSCTPSVPWQRAADPRPWRKNLGRPACPGRGPQTDALGEKILDVQRALKEVRRPTPLEKNLGSPACPGVALQSGAPGQTTLACPTRSGRGLQTDAPGTTCPCLARTCKRLQTSARRGLPIVRPHTGMTRITCKSRTLNKGSPGKAMPPWGRGSKTKKAIISPFRVP